MQPFSTGTHRLRACPSDLLLLMAHWSTSRSTPSPGAPASAVEPWGLGVGTAASGSFLPNNRVPLPKDTGALSPSCCDKHSCELLDETSPVCPSVHPSSAAAGWKPSDHMRRDLWHTQVGPPTWDPGLKSLSPRHHCHSAVPLPGGAVTCSVPRRRAVAHVGHTFSL